MLLRKPPSHAEVYNDLDGGVVELFRILRDEERAAEFIQKIRLTPFARAEFLGAYEDSHDPLEAARRLAIRAFMGHGSDSASGIRGVSGFRAKSNRSGTTPAHDWANYSDALPATVERLRGVIVEQRDACEVMLQHDAETTLHYLDPPYVHETRTWMLSGKGKGNYRYELDNAGHERLIETARELDGMVLISGYSHPLYEDALADWRRATTLAHADGARPRTEVLWINPQACAAIDESVRQIEMFTDITHLDGK